MTRTQRGQLFELLLADVQVRHIKIALDNTDTLPNFNEVTSEQKTLPEVINDVLHAVGQQHRTAEFIEAVLAQLPGGQCPPLEAWLKAFKETPPPSTPELGPWWRRAFSSRRSTRFFAAAAATFAAAATAALLIPSCDRQVVLTVHAKHYPNGFGVGGPSRREPLSGAELTFRPSGFTPRSVTPGTTDASGVATIRIALARKLGADATGHIEVLRPLAPEGEQLVPSNYGAWSSQGTRVTTDEAIRLAQQQSVDVDVLTLPDLFLATAQQRIVWAATTTPASVGVDVATALRATGAELKLNADEFDRSLERLVTASSRPALAADGGVQSWDGRDLRAVSRRVAPAVCYVVPADTWLAPYEATGFVAADGVVLTFLAGGAMPRAVAYGSVVGAAGDRTYAVRGVLYRNESNKIALLDVPELRDASGVEPLRLAEADPAADRTDRPVAVFGYPTRDVRLPKQLNAAMFGDGPATKRVMPGLSTRGGSGGDGKGSFAHDATTGAGVSGGPVVDLETGLVVAVHQGGSWTGLRKDNFATPIWELLKDESFAAVLRSHNARLGSRSGKRLVITRVVHHQTPQSGTWLHCFRAAAGSVSNEHNIPDKEYRGDNAAVETNLVLEPVTLGEPCRFHIGLDDDQADVCSLPAEDQTDGTFTITSSGQQTFSPNGRWSYTVFWRAE